MRYKKLLIVFPLLLLSACGTFSNNDNLSSTPTYTQSSGSLSIDDVFGSNLVVAVPVVAPVKNEVVEPVVIEVKAESDNKNTIIDRIDYNNIFKANIVENYYGIPVLVLRFKDLEWYLGYDKNKNKNQSQSPVDLDYFLTSSIRPSSNTFSNIKLSESEINLLTAFSLNSEGRDKTLIVLYVSKAGLSNWSSDKHSSIRAVYTQSVVTFLYNNIKNIRIEKRYSPDVPEDEVFLAMFTFEGNLGYNAYNSTITTSTEWLASFTKKQKEKIDAERKRRIDLEAIVSNVGSGLEPSVDR